MEMQARLEQGPRKKEPELTEFLHRVRGCFSQLSPNFRVVLFVPGGGLHPASPWGTKLDGVSGQRKHLSSGKSFPLLVPSLLLIAFSSSRCLLRKHLLECFLSVELKSICTDHCLDISSPGTPRHMPPL